MPLAVLRGVLPGPLLQLPCADCAALILRNVEALTGGATGGIAAVAGQQSAGAGGVGELFSASRPGW
jgi:hypothetical protein